jgi:L-2-hydroxyglutarate oxidase LhgO
MQLVLAVFIIRIIIAATEKNKKVGVKNTEANSTIVHPAAYQLR